MPEEKEKQEIVAFDILSVFTDKFLFATEETYTDTFSSKEINALLFSHFGDQLGTKELHASLTQKGYCYQLVDCEFVWLCRKA